MIEQLYSSLVASGSVGAPLQQSIFDYGRRHKRWTLLKALAALPSLSESVDRQLGGLSSAVVLSAWVRRDRPAEVLERIAAAESRSVVLASVAESTKLQPGTYRLLAEAPGRAVAQALANNLGAPLGVRAAAVTSLVTDPKAPESQAAQLAHVLAGEPVLVEAASFASDLSTLNVLAGSELLSASAQARVLATLVRRVEADPGQYVRRGYLVYSALTTLAGNPVLEPDVALEGARALRGLQADRRNQLPACIARLEARGLGNAGTPSGVVERVRRATTSASILDIIAGTPLLTPGLVDAIALNPASDVAVFKTVAHVLPRRLVRLVASRLSTEVLVAVVGRNPNVFDDAMLEHLRDPGAALVGIIREVVDQRRAIPAALALSRYLGPDSALRLPLRYLARADLPACVHHQVAVALGLVGRDNGVWEVFETLGRDFEGTLDELLVAADTL